MDNHPFRGNREGYFEKIYTLRLQVKFRAKKGFRSPSVTESGDRVKIDTDWTAKGRLDCHVWKEREGTECHNLRDE